MSAPGHGTQPPPGAGAGAADAAALAVGDEVEVLIGPVAHGGHCVARHEGRVIFVRHALPGERAVVRITEARTGSFCRGDAVRILQPDPGRVSPPCVHFRPGGCGGCDFQHATADLQRRLKAAVLAEQLRRLAGLEIAVTVEPLGDGDGFGWRTRVRWALDPQGRIGPRVYRSHRVVSIGPGAECLIADPELSQAAAVLDVPRGVVRPVPAQASRASRRDTRRSNRSRAAASRPLPEVALTLAAGRVAATWPGDDGEVVVERAAGRDFAVRADGFWQAHARAADTLARTVGAILDGHLAPGGTGWDLYGGVGLFAEVLADAVGPSGTVVTVESDTAASALAAENLAGRGQVRAVAASVEQALAGLPRPDAVVVDPPRTGVGPALCREIAMAGPDLIVYVACDPAALGRDTAALLAAGYRLEALRAFDAFPQTHHLECVASFRRE